MKYMGNLGLDKFDKLIISILIYENFVLTNIFSSMVNICKIIKLGSAIVDYIQSIYKSFYFIFFILYA